MDTHRKWVTMVTHLFCTRFYENVHKDLHTPPKFSQTGGLPDVIIQKIFFTDINNEYRTNSSNGCLIAAVEQFMRRVVAVRELQHNIQKQQHCPDYVVL